jgi:hypothetical protein
MLLNPDRPFNDLRLELEYDLDADTGIMYAGCAAENMTGKLAEPRD